MESLESKKIIITVIKIITSKFPNDTCSHHSTVKLRVSKLHPQT